TPFHTKHSIPAPQIAERTLRPANQPPRTSGQCVRNSSPTNAICPSAKAPAATSIIATMPIQPNGNSDIPCMNAVSCDCAAALISPSMKFGLRIRHPRKLLNGIAYSGLALHVWTTGRNSFDLLLQRGRLVMAHRDMLHCGGPTLLTEHCGHGRTFCPARSRLT